MLLMPNFGSIYLTILLARLLSLTGLWIIHCLLDIILALAIDDNAFKSEHAHNVHNIFWAWIPSDRLRWKERVLDLPVFRQSTRKGTHPIAPLKARIYSYRLQSIPSSRRLFHLSWCASKQLRIQSSHPFKLCLSLEPWGQDTYDSRHSVSLFWTTSVQANTQSQRDDLDFEYWYLWAPNSRALSQRFVPWYVDRRVVLKVLSNNVCRFVKLFVLLSDLPLNFSITPVSSRRYVMRGNSQKERGSGAKRRT